MGCHLNYSINYLFELGLIGTRGRPNFLICKIRSLDVQSNFWSLYQFLKAMILKSGKNPALIGEWLLRTRKVKENLPCHYQGHQLNKLQCVCVCICV